MSSSAIRGMCAGAVALAAAGAAWGQAAPRPAPTAPPRAAIGGTPPAPCITVDIAGHRAGQAECAAATLERGARAAQQAAAADPRVTVPDARSGDLRVGVGTLAGANQRYGTDLRGATRLPSRPVPPPPSSPLPWVR